ncbi:hypothetical protein NL676_009510 [Syzygium grande]|nr:hypothetical protein NL676_009510 [Syzygium grande]
MEAVRSSPRRWWVGGEAAPSPKSRPAALMDQSDLSLAWGKYWPGGRPSIVSGEAALTRPGKGDPRRHRKSSSRIR